MSNYKTQKFKRFENNFLVFKQTSLGKFSLKVYNLLVENFPQSFFVGGAVRDLLLGKKIYDVDISTSAEPDQVTQLLAKEGIKYDETYKNFGNITAILGSIRVEITTLRKDIKSSNRYPVVKFIKSNQVDSKRRDFTINSLYLSTKHNIIYDFHDGVNDILAKKVRFIGTPALRIKEDPLRILRALRFSLTLNLSLEHKTKQAIKNNFKLIKKLTEKKVKKEVLKIKNKSLREILNKVISDEKNLDKYFK